MLTGSQRFPYLAGSLVPDIAEDHFERIGLYEETSFLVTLADPQGNMLENITPVVCECNVTFICAKTR